MVLRGPLCKDGTELWTMMLNFTGTASLDSSADSFVFIWEPYACHRVGGRRWRPRCSAFLLASPWRFFGGRGTAGAFSTRHQSDTVFGWTFAYRAHQRTPLTATTFGVVLVACCRSCPGRPDGIEFEQLGGFVGDSTRDAAPQMHLARGEYWQGPNCRDAEKEISEGCCHL